MKAIIYEKKIQRVREAMETRWSWVQLLHSTVASSELGDMYEVHNREVSKFGYLNPRHSGLWYENLPIR